MVCLLSHYHSPFGFCLKCISIYSGCTEISLSSCAEDDFVQLADADKIPGCRTKRDGGRVPKISTFSA